MGQRKISKKTKKKSSQWWLYKTLQEIVPTGVDILEEYKFPTTVLQTENVMIFDIYVPALNIILEYHGVQHYYDHYLFGYFKSSVERDSERRLTCANHNITYLEVPYWWQHDKESITTIVHQVRPDIVPASPIAIPFHYQVVTPKPSKDLKVKII